MNLLVSAIREDRSCQAHRLTGLTPFAPWVRTLTQQKGGSKMSTHLDQAANAMFPQAGHSRVGNIKFFRGRRRQVTAEQLAEELNRADAQVRSGNLKPTADIDGDLTN
jgi:hypothetical protein